MCGGGTYEELVKRVIYNNGTQNCLNNMNNTKDIWEFIDGASNHYKSVNREVAS